MNESPWVRSKGQSSTAAALGGVTVAFAALLTVGVLVSWEPVPDGVSATSVGLLFFFLDVLALAFGVLCWRAARSGCLVGLDGVRIRNPFSEVSIPWSRIERFSLGRAGFWPYVGRVHLIDGSLHVIWGIQAPNIAPDNPRTASLIDGLNEELERRRPSSSPPATDHL
jgi:hypothetical protein